MDRQDFEKRWRRSRTNWNRFQYLSIQAHHLAGATPPLYEEALKLLDRALGNFHEPVGIASALGLKAKCIQALSGFDDALPIYRQALEFEKSFPNVRTSLWVELPWQIAKNRRASLYDEALKWLGYPQARDVILPYEQFKKATVLAIVADQVGDIATAKAQANLALRCAGIRQGPFANHKKIGLVGEIETWADDALERILKK